MREEFPRKKIGDSLSARHVNEMSDVARRFGRMTPGSYLRGVHTRHYVSLSGLEPFQQFTFLIASDEGDGLYKGRTRWYDTDNTDWEPDVSDLDDESASYDPEEWNIDAGNIGIGLSVGDYVVCYWDQQRGMFVPVAPPGLVGFELAEAHPGRGLKFDVYVGAWDPAIDGWDYDCDNEFACIDWRYGVPYPGKGTTGLGQWHLSDTHGRILEVVSLDCQIPDDGPTCS